MRVFLKYFVSHKSIVYSLISNANLLPIQFNILRAFKQNKHSAMAFSRVYHRVSGNPKQQQKFVSSATSPSELSSVEKEQRRPCRLQ